MGKHIEGEEAAAAKPKHPFLSSVKEFLLIVVVAILLSVGLNTFVAQPFRIPSSSMENTLLIGDQVLVTKINKELKRGDVAGIGGDRVKCCTADGKITVNGKAITEPYLKPGSHPSLLSFDVKVPANSYWMMGDNRDNSGDSRLHMSGPLSGAIAQEDIVGPAKRIMWPVGRWGSLGAQDVFESVK